MQKALHLRGGLFAFQTSFKSRILTVDGGRRHCDRSRSTRCQVKREVVGIPLVHHFHPQVGTVDHVSPGANHSTLGVNDALVEVESVQVERHRADAQCREPNSNDWPRAEQEVQGTTVVEGGILEDQPTEVAVRCHNVVGLFFLSKLVSGVLRFVLGGLSH